MINEIEEKGKPLGLNQDASLPLEEEFEIVEVGQRFNRKTAILNLLILLLVASASFGLGRLAYYDSIKEPISIKNINQEGFLSSGTNKATLIPENPSVQGASIGSGGVVASKNSNKYHAPWCPGAKQISEVNKVYYSSAEEAKKAGLTPAGNCKGLE